MPLWTVMKMLLITVMMTQKTKIHTKLILL